MTHSGGRLTKPHLRHPLRLLPQRGWYACLVIMVVGWFMMAIRRANALAEHGSVMIAMMVIIMATMVIIMATMVMRDASSPWPTCWRSRWLTPMQPPPTAHARTIPCALQAQVNTGEHSGKQRTILALEVLSYFPLTRTVWSRTKCGVLLHHGLLEHERMDTYLAPTPATAGAGRCQTGWHRHMETHTHTIEARRTGVTNRALHWSLTNLVRPNGSVEEGAEKHVGWAPKKNRHSERHTHTHTRLKRDEQADRQSTALVANESRQAVRKSKKVWKSMRLGAFL